MKTTVGPRVLFGLNATPPLLVSACVATAEERNYAPPRAYAARCEFRAPAEPEILAKLQLSLYVEKGNRPRAGFGATGKHVLKGHPPFKIVILADVD